MIKQKGAVLITPEISRQLQEYAEQEAKKAAEIKKQKSQEKPPKKEESLSKQLNPFCLL